MKYAASEMSEIIITIDLKENANPIAVNGACQLK
jgi:hypothetical protein